MEEYRQLGQLIELSTGENVQKPDVQAFTQVAEAIRSRSDMPKEAVKVFQKRLATKNTRILMLTLELIDFCTQTCEVNLHSQFSSKDFLMRLGSILNNQKDIDEIVKKRILALIQTWYQIFVKDIHQLFYNFYENVQQKGFQIPQEYQSSYKQYRNQVQSKPSPQKNYNNYDQGISVSGTSGNSNRRSDRPVNPKFQKLRENIKIMEQNMELINNLIDEHKLGSPVQSNETLFQLAENLDSRADQFVQLIGNIEDEDMLQYTIQVNEVLLKTLDRYKALKKGQKPPPLNDNTVEQEILQQIEELELREKQQKLQAQNFGFEFQGASNANNFGNQRQEPIQQQQVPVQKAPKQVPQTMVDNLIDLIDDVQPSITSSTNQNTNSEKSSQPSQPKTVDLFEIDFLSGTQVQQTSQQQQQPLNQVNQVQNNQGLGQIQVKPPIQENIWGNQTQNQTPIQQFPQQQPLQQSQFPQFQGQGQPVGQNQFQQSQVIQQNQPDKYSALEQLSYQPQRNNFQSYQQPGGFQQGFNPQFQHQQQFQSGYFPPQQQQPFGNQWGTQSTGYNNFQVQQPPQQQPPFGFQNNQQFQSQVPISNSTKPSQFINAGQQQITIKESSPFDDLDDMFGIKVPTKNNASSNSTVQSSTNQPKNINIPVQQSQQVQASTNNANKNLFDDFL